MLKSIKLKNYILVKEIELHFEEGLNIFSGETGAGKSVIIEAINTVLGGQVKNGMLFDKNTKAEIELVFTIDDANFNLEKLITANGIDVSEGELFFSKIINTNLKAAAYINGIRTTNSVIKEFRTALIDFHSQRDQQKLFDNEYQLEIIDAFGNLEGLRNKFTDAYKMYEAKLKEYKNLLLQEKTGKDKFDLYSYQIEEIRNAGLKDKEDEELESEYQLLNHAEDLQNLEREYRTFCFDIDNSIFDRINSFLARLSDFDSDNPRLKQSASYLQECLANLEETASELEQLSSSIDLDPQRLIDVSERIDFLNSLKNKYNRSISEIISFADEISLFMKNYNTHQDTIKALAEQLKTDLSNLKILADQLSSARKKTALKFQKKMVKDIRQLSMPAAVMEVKFYPLSLNSQNYFQQITDTGNDSVEFYFSANKGKEMQPLKSAASGGEQSRFLLAVKKILAEHLSSKTVVFDEIDSGIGGKTAELTGEYISDIAGFHQVICITHLAQIAVFGDCQFLISKLVKNNISQIEVKKLDNNQKTLEIARMLSGSDSSLAIKHAEELRNKISRK